MKRKEILEKAASITQGEREQDYGTPESNFGRIAGLWNAYLGLDGFIHPEDVAAMMILVKTARIASGNAKDDNWVDIAGYAACGGEIESEGK